MSCIFTTPSADDMGDPRCIKCGVFLPDCFDLEEWILENHPEVHKALKYLTNIERLKAFKEVWSNDCCPRNPPF